jgi:putative membrane protein
MFLRIILVALAFGASSHAYVSRAGLPRGVRHGGVLRMVSSEAETLHALSQQALVLAEAGDITSVNYAGLVLVSMSLAVERALIKPQMSIENEKLLGYADILYGLAGTLVLVSGYYRVTEYGKGWEFYSHEPIFWVKMLLFAVMGASSLFPTIKIVQRAIKINDAEKGKGPMPELMSEALATRMTKIVNGELLAIGSIPLAASLMSRGVGYFDAFPWPLGAGIVGAAVVGLGVKYSREALSFKE